MPGDGAPLPRSLFCLSLLFGAALAPMQKPEGSSNHPQGRNGVEHGEAVEWMILEAMGA